jgi:predicted flap endonuclease-1-like 5' DNA nuclease
MMALYPSTSGAAVVSWSIEPTLPSGVFFGTSNGTIYGTPNTLTDSTVYTINASGVEDYGTATVTLSVLLDTDLDGIPDVNDDDIDNDGWSNVDETNCQTDEMDENDYPSDIDQDRICDLLDTSDDRAIIVIYMSNSVELANDSAMNSLIPITAGGDIDTWEIYPALPLGLEFNGTMPGRSTSDTGTISGTPTELSPATVYTIWANNTNSGQSGSFQITLSVLLDSDGDGTPDVYDDDMDGDGWSNEMENLCGEDPTDASSTPIDTDGDGLCNYIDSDDDNDSFIDTEEIMCNSNATDIGSIPIDADNDGICDALQSDRDLDGWADGPEESCGSDPDDASSMPTDSDGDMICDSQDDDRDGDFVGNNVDDFPDDRSASKDTDGDGKPDSLSGTSTSDPPLDEDFDDDNDNWKDYKESECGTDPLDEFDFPTDSDGDGTCDALEDDTDGDGVVDADDAFPMDPDEDTDTDGDGVGDNADEDDDGDNWSDADEDRCGSDGLDAESIPENIEDETTCITVKNESKDDDDDDSSTSTMWWLCVCFPLLLLLLLIPLIYWSRERGDSLLVMVGMRNGPEPEHTTARPNFVSGSGTKNDPFVLKPGHVENFGDSCESKETITIANLDPESLITITDMATHTNRGRFNMDSVLVEGNSEDKGKGSIVFTLKFDDNVTEDDFSGVYNGQIRIGSASVYINWEVKVGDPEADELAEADRRAKELKAQEDAERKAIKEAEEKDKADKKAADKMAKASAEKEATDKKIKEAEEKAEAKASAEKEAADKKIKEAEEKAAAAEAKAAAAEDKAASEKKARENAEDSARVVAEQAAKERLEQMDKEMEERRKKLDEMDEATRKKEEELLRISEKAKTIDFATIGVATSDEKDDLQRIKGVGPFIEDKLNALGIYTFEQVGNMTSEIEEQVNIAIEFFPGRIKRDKWAKQAKKFADQK